MRARSDTIFLEHLIPFGLHIDIIDPEHRLLVIHAEVLQIHHIAILAQELTRHGLCDRDGQIQKRSPGPPG